MSVLQKISDQSVFVLDLTQDKTEMRIMEACDFYYEVKLSKQEVKQLIEELTLLHNKMIPQL